MRSTSLSNHFNKSLSLYNFLLAISALIIIITNKDSRFLAININKLEIFGNAFLEQYQYLMPIIDSYQQALEKGSAIPAVSSTDTIRITEGTNHHVVDRANVMMIQTPQTFNAALLKKAFEQAYQPSFTDEANVLEASGTEVFLIEGEYENIKITRPLDLAIANYILAKRISKD